MSTDIILGTGLSAVTPSAGTRKIYYQLLNGKIQQKVLSDGPSTPIVVTPDNALPLTPLASVCWDDGNEFRMYYLDSNFTIQESCTVGSVRSPGDINKLGVKAVPGAGLAATMHNHQGQIRIRVFYQEHSTGHLRELLRDGDNPWRHGDMHIVGAISKTRIAAVTYRTHGQTNDVVFYQSQDQSLRDYIFENGKWAPGQFNPAQARGLTPLGVVFNGVGNVGFQVFWRDLNGNLASARYTGSWEPQEVIPIVGPGYEFSVIQWGNGEKLRIYYQKSSGVVSEVCSDDRGTTWKQGVEPV